MARRKPAQRSRTPHSRLALQEARLSRHSPGPPLPVLPRLPILLISLWLAAPGLPGGPAATAQTTVFGKNKVQYENFDWRFIQSTHFDVYFDEGDEGIASFTADAAESAYVSVEQLFRYKITARIPIVVYNSHNTFQQTNVVSSYLEEGIGGVTELFKNRVVVPFEGDYRKFRHVIHHELVHAVINDMFYGGSIQSIITNNITLQLPLWFNEGLAEYAALKWDTNSDMFMRDATLHEYLPPINNLYGYFAYRGGQSVWNYIATKYGEQEIPEILARVRSSRNVDAGFRLATGMSIAELSEKWTREQKVLYWPDIAKRAEPADYARALTNHSEDGSFYNTSPAISPKGDRLAFISNRREYFDIYLLNTATGEVIDRIADGQRTADFEELHLLTPGMSWSPDSRRVAVAVKSGSSDAIIIIDVDEGDEEKIAPGLDGIFSVDWSDSSAAWPQGRLAFTGMKGGRSDIYIWDPATSQLTNLTDDVFSDSDPTWSNDGRSVFFSSDRRNNLVGSAVPAGFRMQDYDYGQLDLYSVDVQTKVVSRLTDLPGSDETSPVAFPDGKRLLFISDKNGINNVYSRDLVTGEVRPLTNSISGIYQLSLSRDGYRLAFSSLNKAGFDLFLMNAPIEQDLGIAELEKTEFFREHREPGTRRLAIEPDTVAVADGVLMARTVRLKGDRSADQGVNVRNHVFRRAHGDSLFASRAPAAFPTVTDNLDEDGNYRVNKYKLNFSPDIVYGTAGYNTIYGVSGSTIFAFSDMLGDHQIFLLTNLLFDLKNSDYAIAYLYLPKRIDYGIQAFHSARQLLIYDPDIGETVNRFRNYGVSLFALYPLNRFERLDLGLSWSTIVRENLDLVFIPREEVSVVAPSMTYVLDNSLWGMIAPATGRRLSLTVMGSPKFSDRTPGFYSLLGDYRHYYRLGENYTFALRLAGGGSFGANPQRFIVGGVDNWINGQFAYNSYPIEETEDYLFLTTGVPLRGYDYAVRDGTHYALVNMELRFPLFGYLAAGPLPLLFQTLTGVLFLDAGTAWTDTKDLRLFGRDADGNLVTQDLLTGMGMGTRMIFIGFLLKFDVAWAYNGHHFSDPKYYFSLGVDI